MRHSMQWLVIVALAVNLMGVGTIFAQGMPGASSAPGKSEMGSASSKAALVNINTADEAKLTSLKGIGPAKAKSIIQYRQEHGPFKTVDELKNVSGIGDKTLAALKPFITVAP